MCSESCSQNPDHLLECQFLASCKVNPADFNFECEPLYDAITPLRMYGLKSQKPDSWKILMEMESHAKLWKKVPGWMEAHKPILDFLLKKVKAKGLDEDLICILLGIGYTNDFSTDSGNGTNVRLTYAKTSMFSHDCSPNLVRYIDKVDANFTMKIYASRNITKGEKVAITYIDLLAPGPIRKDDLKKVLSVFCLFSNQYLIYCLFSRANILTVFVSVAQIPQSWIHLGPQSNVDYAKLPKMDSVRHHNGHVTIAKNL